MPARKPNLELLAAAAARRAAKQASQRSRANTAKRGATKAEQSAAAKQASARAYGRELGRQVQSGKIESAKAGQLLDRIKLPLPQRRAAEQSRTSSRVTGLHFDEDGQLDGTRAPNLGALRAAPSTGTKVLGGHYEVVPEGEATRWIAYVVDDKGRIKGATPLGLSADEAQANAEDLASIGKYKTGSASLNVVLVPLGPAR